jgi:hypothetical protein
MTRSRAKKEVMAKSGNNWIQGAINPEHRGALHKTLGVTEGKKIPAKKLEEAAHSQNPLTSKRANLVEILKGFGRK